MSIDRIDWHSGSEGFPDNLPDKAGGTHIGMFLAWILINDLHGEVHRTDSIDAVNAVKSKLMTGAEFLIKECDGKLWEDDLNVSGIAFVKYYYETGKYYGDYINTLMCDLPTQYHIIDNWENYDKLSIYIDKAYVRWTCKQNKKWWQFWY